MQIKIKCLISFLIFSYKIVIKHIFVSFNIQFNMVFSRTEYNIDYKNTFGYMCFNFYKYSYLYSLFIIFVCLVGLFHRV